MEVSKNTPVPPSSTVTSPTTPSTSIEGVLQAIASEPVPPMDAQVKASQRAALLLATTVNDPIVAPKAEPSLEPEARPHWRTWFALGGASFAFVAAALLFFIHPVINPSGSAVAVTRFENVNRLLVPDGRATDFFSVPAASAQEMGAEDGLILTSRVPLTTEQVRATVQVTPFVPVEVVSLGGNSFKIIPKGDIAAATSYRISLPTLVANADGSRSAKEYAWSLQPQDRLQVISTIPQNAATYVPVSTGIEFAFNHIGLQVTSSTITVTPSTPGRIETHGQTLVFVPAEPLKPGILYEARLTGVKTDAGLSLTEEKQIRFETVTNATQAEERTKELSFATEFIEAVPQKEIRLGVFKGSSATVQQVDITGYALNADQARVLVDARARLPIWSEQARRTFSEYTSVGAQEAFRVHTAIQSVPEAQGFGTVSLPALPQTGFYALRMQADGVSDRWAFLQVTRIASYTSADAKTVLLWTVNGETNKPLSNVEVKSDEGMAHTTEEGTAQIPAPAFLGTKTTTNEDATDVRIISLQQGTDQSFVVLSSARTFSMFGSEQSALIDTWGYLFGDRPLYHTKDELRFSGITLDRDTHTVPENLHVQIVRSRSFIDAWTGKSKIYQDTAITPDVSGRFQGTFSWDALAPGYYSVVLTRGNEPVLQRTFEVRTFVKPAYTIDVTSELPRVYAGQTIPLTVQAHFFDGTPFPKATLRLKVMQGGREQESKEIYLDAQGMAQISYTALSIGCDFREGASCNMMEPVEFDVRPTSGEEGEIVGTTSIEVYASSIDLRALQQVDQGKAIITLQARDRDLRLTTDQADQALPHPNLEVRGEAVGYYYEAVPQGTYYDFVQKEVKTSYRYERRRDPQPISFHVVTDAKGEAEYRFPMNPARDYYEVSVQTTDAEHRIVSAFVIVSKGWSDLARGTSDGGRAPRLMPSDAQTNHEFSVGENAALTYLHGTESVDLAKTPGLLVFTAARGIHDVKVLSTTNVPIVFDEANVPNAEVHAVTFFQGHFETAQATLLYKKSEKQLTLTLTPAQKQVHPGEEIVVAVHVETKVRDTQVVITAVDQALFALTGPQNEDPLTMLYDLVPSGLRFLSASHRDEYDGYAMGGAEASGMGSGNDRSQTSRRTFKDTAAFQIVNLDAQGNGTFSFTAPDNITSWHLTAVGYNADLETGIGMADVAVGQASFVDVVLPPRALLQDQPVMSVRAFGRGLTASSTVSFTVDAPTLGIQHVQATRVALVPTYFTLTHLVTGVHKITITAQTSAGTDTIERTIEVVPSFFTKRELRVIDAAPGVGLPPIGDTETEITIAGTGRAALLSEVQALSELDGVRLDTLVTRALANTLLRDVYKQSTTKKTTEDFLNYQFTDADGMLKLLPYGSSDTLLTAEIAMTAPQFFDGASLQAGLFTKLSNVSSTRDEQIASLAALASLHQPVIHDLAAIAKRTDLTLQQRLWIAQGLLQAGDQKTANELVTKLLSQTTTVDQQTFLQVDRLEDRIELTAQLAALCASLGRPEAENLHAFVASVWNQDAFPVLAKIRYLQARLQSLPVQDGKIMWTVQGTTEESMDLKEEPVRFFTLTSREAQQFRIKSVSGNARIILTQKISGRPGSVPDLQITRSYEMSTSTTGLGEGDEIKIKLIPTWQKTAREGCYLVRDHVPGGLQPVLRTHYSVDRYFVNDFDAATGEISFVVCKQSDPVAISYTARVVTRGTYVAEAPVMEHLEYPQIAAIGKDETIIVR